MALLSTNIRVICMSVGIAIQSTPMSELIKRFLDNRRSPETTTAQQEQEPKLRPLPQHVLFITDPTIWEKDAINQTAQTITTIIDTFRELGEKPEAEGKIKTVTFQLPESMPAGAVELTVLKSRLCATVGKHSEVLFPPHDRLDWENKLPTPLKDPHAIFPLNSSARRDIATSIQNLTRAKIDPDAIDEQTISSTLLYPYDIDLMIFTGNEPSTIPETRIVSLNNYGHWQAAYAEIAETPTSFHELSRQELQATITLFQQTDRRFGALPGNTTPRTR